MPLSYFPPLPENIWGNLGGNIELQSDLIELIESQSKSNAEKVNLIINPNFSVWQRCSNSLSVVGRSRNTNVATIETALPHGYEAGDVLQIYAMNDSSKAVCLSCVRLVCACIVIAKVIIVYDCGDNCR